MLIAPNSSFITVIPNWISAIWYGHTFDYELLTKYPTDSKNIFSAKDISGLTPENATFTDEGRVFLGPIKWGVEVLYRDRNTIRRQPELLELHCAFGHCAPDKLCYIINNTPSLKEKFPKITSPNQIKLFCKYVT